MKIRWMWVPVLAVLLSGCWNGENVSVSLGDVSVGQQLLDLKTALDEEALTQEEYEATKRTLLALNNLCQNTNDEQSGDEGGEKQDEEFDWF